MEGGFYEIQKKMVGRHSVRRDDDDIHAGIAGEAAEGGADADAVWTVKNADGKVVGNYNEIQEAFEKADDNCKIY